jgi:hypothetical protein
MPRRRTHRYPSDKRLGGLQNRSGPRGDETNLASTGSRTPISMLPSPWAVAVPTALSRLCTDRTAGVQAEIRTKHLPNTSARRNLYAISFVTKEFTCCSNRAVSCNTSSCRSPPPLPAASKYCHVIDIGHRWGLGW